VRSRFNRAEWRLPTLVLAAAAFVIRFGCGYDPHFQSGVTRCAPMSVAKRCPDGYMCVGELCVTAVTTGDGGGSGAGTGGGGQTTGAGGTAAGGNAGAGSGGIAGTAGMSGGGTGGKATGGTAGTVGGTGGVVGTGGRAGNGAGGMVAGLGGMPGTGGIGAGGSMTGTIVTYKVPTAGAHPYQITVGPDNNLWFVEAAASKVGRITTSGTFTEFPTTTDSAGPSDIVSLGGFLWFAETNINKIGKCDMSGTMLGELPIMVGTTTSTVTFLAAGPDGNIWYTDASNDNIGRMTPAGTSTLFTSPQVSEPLRIAAGPDGNLWFTEFIGNRISSITPTGTITRYTIMTTSAFPVAIGSDNSTGLAFLEIGKVGRITTAGTVTGEYQLPNVAGGNSVSNSQGGNIVLGPDGNFWFSNGADSIIRMTPTGAMTRYIVPQVVAGTQKVACGMVAGPDGNLWFADLMQNFIGRISP
jgi:streptogramin lyase